MSFELRELANIFHEKACGFGVWSARSKVRERIPDVVVYLMMPHLPIPPRAHSRRCGLTTMALS